MRTTIVSVVLVAATTTAQADESLDRAAISDGIAKVMDKVMACQSKLGGKVQVAVTVAPDGNVTKATPATTDKDLGSCVAAAIMTAAFPATTTGGSFSYPFVFEAAKQPVMEIGPDDMKAAGAPSPKPPAGPPALSSLDRSNIVYVVSTLRSKVHKCADKSKIGGSLKVRIAVKPDGRVATATHEDAMDPKLGQCIANLFKAARFSKTQSGGVFTYPFRFGIGIASTPATGTPPPAQGELDRATISAGVAKAKTAIAACGDRIKTGGTVKVKVAVAADGSVTSASQDGTLTELGTCVVDVIKTVKFDKTASGGSFSYPFVFDAAAGAAPVATGGTALDRAGISAGIAKVKSKITDCTKVSAAKGSVKVKVTVLPSGAVSNVVVDTTPDAALGACVAGAVQKAVFPATQQGGSFSYPFVF